MVKKKLPVRWSPKAEQRLDGIYDYIADVKDKSSIVMNVAEIELDFFRRIDSLKEADQEKV